MSYSNYPGYQDAYYNTAPNNVAPQGFSTYSQGHYAYQNPNSYLTQGTQNTGYYTAYSQPHYSTPNQHYNYSAANDSSTHFRSFSANTNYPYDYTQIPTPPPIPALNNQHEERKKYLDSLTCEECQNVDIDLILLECRHSYHISCFYQYCKKCDAPRTVTTKPLIDPKICFICSSASNIIHCETCQTPYCFLCVNHKVLPDCCKPILQKLSQYSTQCPGCEFTLPYSEFCQVKCKSHDLLCIKCWNLGVIRNLCVLGCEIKLNLAKRCLCAICQESKPAYLDSKKCENCEVCLDCQWTHNFSQPNENFTCAKCGLLLG